MFIISSLVLDIDSDSQNDTFYILKYVLPAINSYCRMKKNYLFAYLCKYIRCGNRKIVSWKIF